MLCVHKHRRVGARSHMNINVVRIVMSAWAAAAAVHGAALLISIQPSNTLTQTDGRHFVITMWELVLWTVLKLFAVELTVISNTNCHLCSSSTLRSHTPALGPAPLRCPSRFHWLAHRSLCVRNSWLAHPSRPPSPLARRSSRFGQSRRGLCGGGGKRSRGRRGRRRRRRRGSGWPTWGERGRISENKLPHLASLCLKR